MNSERFLLNMQLEIGELSVYPLVNLIPIFLREDSSHRTDTDQEHLFCGPLLGLLAAFHLHFEGLGLNFPGLFRCFFPLTAAFICQTKLHP